jgi:L-iditol 2-dehydrogenase
MKPSMRALLLIAQNKLVLEEVPVPALGPGEVRVHVRACGICGSDVHGLDGRTGRRIPPLIMGHEAAGEIAALGPEVHGWREGDRVTFDSTIYCGECAPCRRGAINLCEHRQVLGVSCADYRRHGAFAEYVNVPARVLFRLPAGLAFERAALAEPVAVAVHAVNRTPLAGSGARVAVVGAGMIGLLIVQVLRVRGCAQIIAVDLDMERLALARRLGATATVDAATDPTAAVRTLTGGTGVDASFEVVGATTPLQTAIDCTRKGGSVTLVGNLAPRVELPLQTVVTGELHLIASCASAGEYPASLELIATGQVNLSSFISATPPLAEGPEWFRRLQAEKKGLLKVVLCP